MKMSQKVTKTPDQMPYFSDFEQGLPVLYAKLGYTFKDVSLLCRALTHRSYDPKKL